MDAFGSEALTATGSADGALAEDYARCAEITRRASSNFYYAFMLLGAERRRALCAVYAFCRFIDDIADDASVTGAASMLALWRQELHNVYAGSPTRAIARALAENVRRFPIPRRYFEEVIDGVEMDLSRTRYATFAELELYCHRVASAVGLICIEIFGYANPSAHTYAERLGLAFQLTNIIRDVSEDAARGRIYLPLEDLVMRFEVSEDEILRGVWQLTLPFPLMEFEVDRARSFYREAADWHGARGSQCEPARPGRGACALLIYAALLERIAIEPISRVLDQRISLSTPRKLYLVSRAWAGARLGLGG